VMIIPDVAVMIILDAAVMIISDFCHVNTYVFCSRLVECWMTGKTKPSSQRYQPMFSLNKSRLPSVFVA
jgi:hypothetical protein